MTVTNAEGAEPVAGTLLFIENRDDGPLTGDISCPAVSACVLIKQEASGAYTTFAETALASGGGDGGRRRRQQDGMPPDAQREQDRDIKKHEDLELRLQAGGRRLDAIELQLEASNANVRLLVVGLIVSQTISSVLLASSTKSLHFGCCQKRCDPG